MDDKGTINVTATVSSIVCKRYANALADLAVQEKSIEKVEADMSALASLLASDAALLAMVRSPRLTHEQKNALVTEMAKSLKLTKLTTNFLNVLVKNRRLNALDGVAKAFAQEVKKRRGIVDVRVETAVALSAKQSKDLAKQVADSLKHDITLQEVVNPEIMGGMILTIGSYMIDDSVRRKLERLGAVLIGGTQQNNTVQNLKEVG